MRRYRLNHRGVTLIELLAAVAIVGVLAALLVARVTTQAANAAPAACELNQGEVELQVQLWRRLNGGFPAASLSDIGANAQYFPTGLPVCPVDGSAYTIDVTDGTVVGHAH